MFSSTIIIIIFGGVLGGLLSFGGIKCNSVKFWVFVVALIIIVQWYGSTVAKEAVEREQQLTTQPAQH